jgi:Domain of unknown function (DUF4335)
MTIRRQYSLPNCTLVLDGLSDGSSTTGIADPRPVMSSLFNAECHFVGHEQPLFGGRDFLTSLVTTVSNYAQEFLSGIPHPLQPQSDAKLVSLVKGSRDNIHHLQATLDANSERAIAGSTTATEPIQVNLNTVQLFDLLEAIDQFLADKRTLPDIMIPLQPIRKAIAEPISTHAAPVGLGVASLVAASLIGYALPTPPVVAPKAQIQTTTVPAPAKLPTAPPASNPQPAATTTPAPSSAAPSKTGTLTGATQLGFLERKLQRDLRQDWQQRDRLKQPASFQVNVNQDGQIVGYQTVGTTNSTQSNLTPLSKLSIKNPNPNQAIGNFNVVFNPTGAIEVKAVAPGSEPMNLGKAITDAKLQATLAAQLKSTLQKSVTSPKPIDSQDLNYRVAVTTTGEIADYAPEDRRAYDNETKTPLPKLAKFNPQAAISQEPLAQYKVTFQPDGKIMVAPK